MDRFDKMLLGPAAVLLLLPAVLLCVPSSPLRAQLPPDEAWKSLETPHFRVTYPQGLEDLARKAGHRGERAWEQLEERFVRGPEEKVDLVITDHADYTNGFTRVFPSNRIYVFAPPPLDGYALTFTDEWMEMVVTHELVHVFHQDLTRGLGSAVRRVFGRIPIRWPTFPGSTTPGWTIEGLATWYESALTGAGRVRGSFHEMLLRTDVLEGSFESINQTSSDAPSWPGGQRWYVYGSLFLDHLLEVYGEDAVGSFVEAVAGQWVPFRVNSAARAAFGVSFTEAWEGWAEALELQYSTLARELAAMAPLTEGERLSFGGHYALSPAPSPGGEGVVYVRFDGRSDAQLQMVSTVDGEARKVTRVNGLSKLGWTPEGRILFSQADFTDPYRFRTDLYLADPGGEVERITREARLDYPDPDPAGGGAVAVQGGGGTNRLVRVTIPGGVVEPLTEFDPEIHWAHPRWSPDGRWIAASRWRPGAYYDLVILDPQGRVVQEVTEDRAVDVSPTWSPDGEWLIWSSDLTGIANLHAVEVDPATGRVGARRQVTNVLGGADYPAVDAEGRWLYYSGYHADGWRIERISFNPGEWFAPLRAHPPFSSPSSEVASSSGSPGAPLRLQGRAEGLEEGYQPLHTLRPTFWIPEYLPGEAIGSKEILDAAYGFSTHAEDLVGRHRYTFLALFSPSEFSRFTGGASYTWAGLGNPLLSVSANQSHDAEGPFLAPDESGDHLYIVERERVVGLGATLTRRRARTLSSFSLTGSHIWEERTLLDASLAESGSFRLNRPNSRLAEGRGAISFANARLFPFSISPEDGIGFFLRGRLRRELALADSIRDVAGEDRSFKDIVGQTNLYKSLPLPGFGHPVIALRGSGGVAEGPGADAYHFEVGGASGGGGGGILPLGQGLLFPLRGYGTAWRSGRFAWSATAELRFPLLFLDRGPGLFPFHLDWLSGSVFFDAGNAWGTEVKGDGMENPMRDPLASVGAEITARIFPLWYQNMELRVGVGVPLVEASGARAYLRLGPAF